MVEGPHYQFLLANVDMLPKALHLGLPSELCLRYDAPYWSSTTSLAQDAAHLSPKAQIYFGNSSTKHPKHRLAFLDQFQDDVAKHAMHTELMLQGDLNVNMPSPIIHLAPPEVNVYTAGGLSHLGAHSMAWVLQDYTGHSDPIRILT